jgi:hypothetical protein
MTFRQDLETFLIPESVISLKLVFDNVRNYLICGAVLSMTLWFQSGKAVAPPIIFNGPPTQDGWQLLIWASRIAFVLLFVLNAYQSYLIGRKALSFLEQPQSTHASSSSSNPAKLPWYLHVLVFVVALVLTGALIVTILAFAFVAIYFSWFAAVKG